MANKVEYGPTHTRMLKLLSDGLPHTRRELHDCCTVGRANNHSSVTMSTVDVHLHLLRKKLRLERIEDGYLTILSVTDADEPSFKLAKILPVSAQDVPSMQL